MSVSLNLQKPVPNRVAIKRISLLTLVWVLLYVINERIWDLLFFETFGLSETNRLVNSLHFFLYDLIKISLLLTGITFFVTYVQSFISLEKTEKYLGNKRQGWGHGVAAVLGTVTPFCSCSSVPIFIGFVGSRIPIGITMTFLIASPLVSEVAFFMLFALFGWKLALLYAAAGLAVSILAGYFLGAIKAEKWIEPFVFERRTAAINSVSLRYSIEQRRQQAVDEARAIYRKLIPYILAGLTLGAAIHGWIPAQTFSRFLGADNPFAVVIAVLVGIPIYANATGVLPIFEALMAKGVPIGTLLAFMMSVIALSFPEMMMLKRVMKIQLLAMFAGVVALGIITVGYLFNWIL
ncbi:MAG: hypothetical protein RL038_129 [Actinomycetota bacterium]|jgi:uncharacterized membrane protein YraQ (UPF0718 family)